MKLSSSLRLATIAVATILALGASPAVFAFGNDFLNGELRDDQIVPGWLDFRTRMYVQSPLPTTGGDFDFTTGWLSVDLDNEPGLYGHKFSQVGVKMLTGGAKWFVYAEPGVTCLMPGSTTDPRLCEGGLGLPLDNWYGLELVNYGQGFWIARMWWPDGTPHDLARINDPSQISYRTQNTFEQGYVDTDFDMAGQFYFWHPQYMLWGTGWQEWWATGGSVDHNRLWPYPQPHVCPDTYAFRTNLGGDPRYWYAGTPYSPIVCYADPLF